MNIMINQRQCRPILPKPHVCLSEQPVQSILIIFATCSATDCFTELSKQRLHQQVVATVLYGQHTPSVQTVHVSELAGIGQKQSRFVSGTVADKQTPIAVIFYFIAAVCHSLLVVLSNLGFAYDLDDL